MFCLSVQAKQQELTPRAAQQQQLQSDLQQSKQQQNVAPNKQYKTVSIWSSLMMIIFGKKKTGSSKQFNNKKSINDTDAEWSSSLMGTPIP